VDSVMSHEEAAELLGAYALDAVAPDEAAAVARHVADCRRCEVELQSFHEVAGMLGNAGGEAPPHVWDRLSAEIALSDHPGGSDDRVVELLGGRVSNSNASRAQQRARRRARSAHDGRWSGGLRWAVTGVAAALALIGVLGYQVLHLDSRVNNLEAAGSQVSAMKTAQSYLTNPQAHLVQLASATSGDDLAVLAILPTGSAYLVNDHMPGLSTDKTYQLWGQVDGRFVSLGLLGNDPGDVAVQLGPDAPIDEFAVTAEPAGGVVQPTVGPLALSRSLTT
jgi:Anti-sigma-K factor rskA/Putative zinc-finger